MNTPAKTDVVVELHVPDFEMAKDFYGKLGFKVVWEREPEGKKGYLVMKRGDSILCFWPGNNEVYDQSYFKRFSRNTKRGYGVEIVLFVKDIEKFYDKTKTFANIVEELVTQPWLTCSDPLSSVVDFRALCGSRPKICFAA